ncbi:MAG: hypothetical protein CMC93_00925 [Flavobacteriaceae bacterium]|nr:hypothetical protein [Flavobacteriaceae bacterium]
MSAILKGSPLRVAIIGVGRWGPNVLGALHRIDGVSVEFVADLNTECLDILKSKFPSILTSTDPEEVIRNPAIDAVAICTPVKSHLDLVEMALTNNKHVFVEKPFGDDPQRCDSLCKLANDKNIHIMVGHVFLFNASILALKQIIDSGKVGEILHIEAHRTNLGPVREDINAMWDLTSHDLSIFDFLLDSNPEEVSCIGSCKLDSNIEDTTYTSFKYSGDVICHAHASWFNPRKVRQITVIGSNKMIIWDDLNLENPITIFDSSIGIDQNHYSDSFATHLLSYNRGDITLPATILNEPLLEELKHFHGVITKNKKNRSSGVFGAKQVRALKAAQESIHAKGKTIRIC